MQFLVLLRRRTEEFDDAAFAPHLDAEANAARALYGDGFARAMWGRGDVPGAVMVAEADSIDAARRELDRLPLVKAGMLEATILPLAPYRGFLPR